jgi:hypothetical protein
VTYFGVLGGSLDKVTYTLDEAKGDIMSILVETHTKETLVLDFLNQIKHIYPANSTRIC